MKTQEMSTRFYRNLRKLNDKKKVTKREILGLYFDLYELLMAISEENRTAELMESLMPPPGVMRMLQIPSDKKEKDAEEKEARPHTPGQYI